MKKITLNLTKEQCDLLWELLNQSNQTGVADWDTQMDLIIAEIERKTA